MKKIGKIAIALVIVLLATACGLNYGTKSFKSKSGIYQIDTISSWTEASPGSLNERAELELHGLRIEKYAMMITDQASNFSSYSDWLNTVITNTANTYGFSASETRDVKVAGYDSKYIEFSSRVTSEYDYDDTDITEMYMRIYFLNGENFYTQLFMWTLEDNTDTVIPEFDDMVNSLKILK